jgi:hypothetical protein
MVPPATRHDEVKTDNGKFSRTISPPTCGFQRNLLTSKALFDPYAANPQGL